MQPLLATVWTPLERGVRRLACMVAGHNYRVLRQMNPGARKVGCDRCGCCWAMHDATRAFVPWNSDFEAMYAPGGPLDPATDPRFHGLPAYPDGEVVGPCVCGSWPGGKCLRCPVTPNDPGKQPATTNATRDENNG